MRQRQQTTALVLSGGGAKGAFQVGAMQVLRDTGYNFDVISGVSVGSLNGAMLATGQFEELVSIWANLSPEKVMKEQSLLGLARRYLFYKIGFRKPPVSKFDNRPLKKLMEKHLLDKQVVTPFHFGYVKLGTGEYIQATISRHGDNHIGDTDIKRVLASTAIPVVFNPVNIGDTKCVDGGLREISPIRDVLPHNPARIIIIPTSPIDAEPERHYAKDIIEIAFRTLYIMLDEIFSEDIDRFLSINDLVRQAESQGVTLKSRNGRRYSYIEPLIIAPKEPLGSTLDFDNMRLRRLMEMGRQRAREVLEEVEVVRPLRGDNKWQNG